MLLSHEFADPERRAGSTWSSASLAPQENEHRPEVEGKTLWAAPSYVFIAVSLDL